MILILQLYILDPHLLEMNMIAYSTYNYYDFDKINCWLRLLIKSCLSGLYFNQSFILLSSSEQLIDNWW